MATTAVAAVLWIARSSSSLRHFSAHRFLTIPVGRSEASKHRRTMAAEASRASGGAERSTAPYGSWKSPITADVVSGAEKMLGGIGVAGDGRIVWIETRPEEGGRAVLVKDPSNLGDKPREIIPPEYAARTLAQEYGGGSFAVLDDVVIFSNYKDQRLYKQFIGGGLPAPLTPDYGGPLVHFADGVFHPSLKQYFTVMEGKSNPITKIVAVNIDDRVMEEPEEIVSGNDFYAFPRIDATGKKIAWIEWSHPNMPWDKAQLWVGYFSEDGQNGRSVLGILNHAKSSYLSLDVPFTYIGNIVSGANCVYVEGASAIHPLSLAKVTVDNLNAKVLDFSVVWSSSLDVAKYSSYFSSPELVKFPTETGQAAYAYFYPPSNADYQAPFDEKPPLIVKSHGGPTAEALGRLDLNIQYWTSRGWAFLDVNYGGSTGYGREYRERLLGQWGIVDVNDCCSCARFLVESGKVDEKRLCITGRSAGGYTTLACLAFRETFKAGASLYGSVVSLSSWGLLAATELVADLTLLRAETHKFESHYIDNLVGDEKAYFERSPINFVDKFTCPVILFQGLDDKVVPPEQARKIYTALKNKGLPVSLVEYEGEQHGFRKAENIKFTLEQQMMFFARLVGNFEVADRIDPIKIDNFD
ncbi:acylaminoacyl-peptidase [Apostasia shenzhenica]|uniref:Acylaminoacyl-peptidase n=1 Tax=Apostasia shenzhenica TaxID=1088818 RepID=A0A2I0A381_9ASPA|nr:acylaminoacyl-peptidase [Apostasia shenzhenica]